MTTEEIKAWLVEIAERYLGDDEAQHNREDALYHAFVRSIAEGTCENPVECAKLILSTEEMRFARWCA
jgi:hypothetical protein